MTLPAINYFGSGSNSNNNNRRGTREPQEEKEESGPNPIELLERIGLCANLELHASQAMLSESNEMEHLGEALDRAAN